MSTASSWTESRQESRGAGDGEWGLPRASLSTRSAAAAAAAHRPRPRRRVCCAPPQVRGKDVPKPIKNWNQAGLSSRLLDVLRRGGFERPLPIQAQVCGGCGWGRGWVDTLLHSVPRPP